MGWNWKIKVAIVLVMVGAISAITLVLSKSRSHPTLRVTLRIAVAPIEQSAFVMAQANAARFKYLVGKKAGLKPVLAQKLIVKTVPNSSLLEAQVETLTKDEARRYSEVFLETLREQCGGRAQVALAQQSIR